ncbi:MAG TPA: hypothetical protein VMV69_06955 [Pirellulales bacterium]|nr:hypothetical protein [Pirellulales bacterium]
MPSPISWYRSPRLWLDLFALANLGCLAPDIYLAHSTNSFRHAAEWVPLAFSLAAPWLLLAGLIMSRGRAESLAWKLSGRLVGWTALAVGITGLLLHLDGEFFRERTLDSLVYTAPFAAPLAYAGIGLLLIMNRMVAEADPEWPRWVTLLALGGWIGNFIFSLADHAQNGFFHPEEWIAVAASALAIGFLAVPFAMRVERVFLGWTVAVMLVEMVVGLVGFYLHSEANLDGPSSSLFDNFVYGAPAMAPLLFPNLALLTLLGLWVWSRQGIEQKRKGVS